MTVDVSGAFSDPDGDALSYGASSGASSVATVSVSGSNVTVTGEAPGTATITVTATDPGGLSASRTFEVTVSSDNNAPTASEAIPDQTLEAGAEVTVDVSAAFSDPDGDALSYEAASDAPGVATASVSVSEVTVAGEAPGTASITVTATDPGGLSATQTFEVTVRATNDAPTVSSEAIPDQTLEAGAEVTVDVSAAFSDPDEDALSYGAASDAPGVATASVSGSDVTVAGEAPGTATITVTATDPGGLSATQTFEVTVRATNDAPTVSGEAIPDQTLEAGAEVTVDVSGAFSDPDGDALSYRATSGASSVATVSVSGSNVTVTGEAPGAATITVTATDPGGMSASQTFEVTVSSANHAPTVSDAIPDQTLEEGTQVTVDVSGAFADPDEDALSYEATSGAPGVASVSVSGSDVTVAGEAPGTATITVTATDPGGLSASQTFEVTVSSANQAPTVSDAIPDQTLEAGAEVTVDVSGAFSDPDGDALSYEATSGAPSVATVSVSGSDVTVTGEAPGAATITVRATDPGGLSATQTFEVTVSSANQAPTVSAAIPDQTLEEGAQVTLDVSAAFSDPDEDALRYEATSDAPGVAMVSVSGSDVTVRGEAPGTAAITVTATDPGGLSASQMFDATVEAPASGGDLDALFAPPTATEIAQVEADWETRGPEVSGAHLELDESAASGSLRVRILSHTVGGVRHYGAVVTPAGAEPGSLPVVLFTHGEDDGVAVELTFLLTPILRAQGLSAAFVLPSYRSEPLRLGNQPFQSDGPPSPWDRDVDDAMSLLSVAFEHAPELDEERVAALGSSRGGAVALLAAARDPRIDAVVEFFGPTDFFGEYAREVFEEALEGELRDLPGLEHLNEILIQPWKLGVLSDAAARLEMVRRSAVYFVDRLPPVQLHHGDADAVVAVSQAHRLVDAMRAAGKAEEDFEAYIYPGSGHDLFSLSGAVTRALEFLRPFLFELP